MASDKKTATTIVIGTGISGLYCAYYLKKQGVDVMMVDANNWVGGRIKPLKGWLPWKTLDLGAEFIHGKDSLLNELTNAEGFPCRLMFTWAQGDGEHPEELFGKEYAMYYLAKEKKLLPYDTDHPDIAKTNEVLFGVSDAETNPKDKRTFEDYLKEKGVSPTGLKLADAGYSNSLCCVSKRMSFYETVKLNQEWDKFGHGDYRLENSMGELVDFLAKGIPIKLSWPVKSINYNGKVIELVNYKGEKVYAPKVVVTVPLTILQQELITFNPPLPPPKQKAIKSLKMENAIKIVLEFSERFWPSRLGGIVCVDTLIPEMWFECPDRVGELTPQSKKVNRPAPAKPTYLISAFACADFANRVTAMSEEQIRLAVIAQIDEMFGNNKAFTYYGKEEATEKTNVPKPATTFYLRFLFQDWAKEPWARGGYTHPAVTSSEQIRSDLAATLDNKLFFAGEHTHPKAYMTMHGAIDTGDIAAKRVLESLAQEKTQAKL